MPQPIDMSQNRPRIVWQTAHFDAEGFAVKTGKVIGGNWIWRVEFEDGRPDLQARDSAAASIQIHSYEDAVATGVQFARDQRTDKSRNRF
ncbi:hypothetical protein [Hydrocarboniphaga effusa]|nr:hypothetical protein [Hydrocarboniphaga effusa]